MKKGEKIKGIITLFALVSILVACGSNQTQTDTSGEISEAEKKSASIKVNWKFYEILQDKEVKGYLLGTVHIGKPEWYPFPNEIEEALQKSEKLILEIGKSDVENEEELADNSEAQLAAMTSDVPLSTTMNEQTKKKYQEILATYGMKEEETVGLSRYGVQTALLATVMMNLDSSNEFSKNGVETKLKEIYEKKNQQEMIGLDTTDFQMTMVEKFNSLPEDINEWVDSLKTKEEMDNSSSSGKSLEDFEAGASAIGDMVDYTDEQAEIMVYERNERWAKEIPKYLKNKNESFIAVGAAHLETNRGLIKLLEKEGYELKPVQFK